MIYVRTEDSGDGLILVEKLIEIYFKSFQIDVKTFGGMKNLKSELETLLLTCNNDDKIIIVYDNIMENPLILKWFRQANNIIKNSMLKDIIIWIPTDSFELEILMIDNIEYFTNMNEFIKYVLPIKVWYDESGDTSYLTFKTKNDNIYAEVYDLIKKKKSKSSIYKALTSEEFESSITIESLSKILLNKCFMNQPINKPMTDCWTYECCYRRNRCKSKQIDTDEIIIKQTNDYFYKIKLLIHNTAYIDIVKSLEELTGTSIEYKDYKVNDIVSKDSALSLKVNSLLGRG